MYFLLFQVIFNNIMAICHRCWQRANNDINRQDLPDENVVDVNRPAEGAQPNEIFVPEYVRAPNSSRTCLYRHCRNLDLRRIPASIRLFAICNYSLYFPPSARLCEEHLFSIIWDELLDNVNVTNHFNAELVSDMTSMLIRGMNAPRLSFDSVTGLDAHELHFWTGLTIEQFNSMLLETPSLAERHRHPQRVLGAYMTKLRTGESNERLATLFGMSRRTFEDHLKIARECLTQDFVSRNLGLNHLSRENVLERNLLIPKEFFGDEQNTKAILILDGTYIYIEKSSNFLFQRQSYSHHKFRNLLKPFIIVSSDGYIIDVLGPFRATTSDAAIMQSLMNEENPLHWFLNSGDVFIVDRGFRDSIDVIQSCGYEVHMPPTKDRIASQLTTEQANKSRCVTICRWVVEAVNGKFKNRFRLLRQTYFNRALSHMFCDFKIAAAIINACYRVAVDNRFAAEIVNIIHSRMNMSNHLHDYVHMKNLNRQRVPFEAMQANISNFEDFPSLSEDEVFLFALGSYHIKLAKSYCAEHLRDGLYLIELYRDNELSDLPRCNILVNNVWLVRVRIQSRHVRSRIYYSYILIDRDLTDRHAIAHWYCTCLTGNRTVGSCAHIISIVWYMGLGRHIDFNAPAQMLDNILIDDLM